MIRIFRLGLLLAALLATPPVAAAERVTVRVGEHPGFGRLVFDWTRPVGVGLEEAPGQARLRFDRAAELDLARVRRDPPPGVRRVTPEPGPEGLSVRVDVAPGSRLRLLQSGSAVVLDVLRPETPLDAPAARRGEAGPPASTTGTAAPPIPVAQPIPDTSADAEGPAVAAEPQAPPGGAAPISLLRPLAPADVPPAPTSAAQAEPKAPGAGRPTANPAGAAQASEPAKSPKKAPGKPAAKPEAKPARAKGAAHAAKKERAKGGPEDQLLVVADQGPPLLDESPVPSHGGLAQTMTNLRFQWNQDVALAAYRRGAHIWLVFDHAPSGDLTRGLVELAPELAPVEQFEAPDATLVRLTASPILTPKIIRDGTTWVVELWPRAPRPAAGVEIGIDARDKPAEMTFRMKRPGRAVSFVDPDSGTRMIVVPAHIEAQGLGVPQSLPQFQALRSFQGLALELSGDGVEVAVEEQSVRVSHRAGLILSQGGTLALMKANERRPAIGPRLFDLGAWRRDGRGNYDNVRRALQMELIAADPPGLAAARLNLARFYLGHGLATEAVGVLRLAEVADPPLPVDPETRLMRGVGMFLGGDYESAAADIFHPSLIGEAEAELWNAAMAAVGFDWDVAAAKFADTEDLIAAYPHRVRTRLWLLAAEARLGIGDVANAGRWLERARADGPSLDEEAQIATLLARRLLLEGDADAAKALWRRVVQASGHRPSQTRARLGLLDLAVEERSITAAEATEELERLRFAWRGDHVELALLRRLAELYLSQGEYRKALRAFRQAAAAFPKSRLAQDVAQRMREAFFEVFVGPESAKLAPLTALAFYEEFRELTPPGVKGDRMIVRLAERLVEVDLLQRAAELLATQVKYRLSGPEKADMGGRLAWIQMLDGQPEQAIAALDLSAGTGLPDELTHKRRYLRARALARLSRYQEALELLGADTQPEALRLRADILWGQGNWPAAALVLTQLVPERSRLDRPLTETESRNAVDLAVALTLAGERARLVEFNKAHGEAMSAGPDRETFALLAGGLAPGDAKSIAEELAGVEQVEKFMASYRDRPQEASADQAN